MLRNIKGTYSNKKCFRVNFPSFHYIRSGQVIINQKNNHTTQGDLDGKLSQKHSNSPKHTKKNCKFY